MLVLGSHQAIVETWGTYADPRQPRGIRSKGTRDVLSWAAADTLADAG